MCETGRISDGILCEDAFGKLGSNAKLLFLLKEAHLKPGEAFNKNGLAWIHDYINGTKHFAMLTKIMKATHMIDALLLQHTHGKAPASVRELSTQSWPSADPSNRSILWKIAYMNLNQAGGGATSNDGKIIAALDPAAFQQRIGEINPDYVIVGGKNIFPLLIRKVYGAPCRQGFFRVADGTKQTVYIQSFHPSAMNYAFLLENLEQSLS